jgi:Na+/proline symporter
VGGSAGKRLSDVGILNDPISLIEIVLLLGSPGLLLGGVAGVVFWRQRRIAGALLGAVAGFVTWLTGWMWLNGAI